MPYNLFLGFFFKMKIGKGKINPCGSSSVNIPLEMGFLIQKQRTALRNN